MMMTIVRVAKVVALLAFILPWVAVSCQGVDLATASGIDLIQGKMTENPDASREITQQMTGGMGGDMGEVSVEEDGASEMPALGMNYFAVGSAVVIVLGLVLTFVGAAASAGRNAIISSLLAAGLAFGATWQFREQLKTESMKEEAGASSEADPFSGMGGAMAGDMIDGMVQYRIGLWAVLGALAVAAGAGGMAMTGRGGASAGSTDASSSDKV